MLVRVQLLSQSRPLYSCKQRLELSHIFPWGPTAIGYSLSYMIAWSWRSWALILWHCWTWRKCRTNCSTARPPLCPAWVAAGMALIAARHIFERIPKFWVAFAGPEMFQCRSLQGEWNTYIKIVNCKKAPLKGVTVVWKAGWRSRQKCQKWQPWYDLQLSQEKWPRKSMKKLHGDFQLLRRCAETPNLMKAMKESPTMTIVLSNETDKEFWSLTNIETYHSYKFGCHRAIGLAKILVFAPILSTACIASLSHLDNEAKSICSIFASHLCLLIMFGNLFHFA